MDDEAVQEDFHERLCKTARKLIAGFENVNRGDRPATAADADWFLGLNISNPFDKGRGRSFVEQVLTFSGDRTPYMGKPGADSPEPRINSAGKTQPSAEKAVHAARP